MPSSVFIPSPANNLSKTRTDVLGDVFSKPQECVSATELPQRLLKILTEKHTETYTDPQNIAVILRVGIAITVQLYRFK